MEPVYPKDNKGLALVNGHKATKFKSKLGTVTIAVVTWAIFIKSNRNHSH